MTQIISAARRTGKSIYVKSLQHTGIVVVPSEQYKKYNRYDNSMTARELLGSLDSEGRIRGHKHRYNYIIEEPGLYDLEFFQLLKLLPEEQIALVIGTPMGPLNLFDWFLQINKKRVTIWSHAEVPEQLKQFGSHTEITGNFS